MGEGLLSKIGPTRQWTDEQIVSLLSKINIEAKHVTGKDVPPDLIAQFLEDTLRDVQRDVIKGHLLKMPTADKLRLIEMCRGTKKEPKRARGSKSGPALGGE